MAGQDYAQLKKLAEKFGTWGMEKSHANKAYEIAPLDADGELNWDKEVCMTAGDDEELAQFITDAPSTILALLARLEKAETERDRLKKAIADSCDESRDELFCGRADAAETALRSLRDSGWLIEKGQLCLGECLGNAHWVTFTDPSVFRFRRKEDAEFFRYALKLNDTTVSEHIWAAALAGAPGDSGSEKKEK